MVEYFTGMNRAVARGFGAGHVGSHLVIVDDADFGGVSIGPTEHDAPLVIHPNRVESPQVALQSLQPVARRNPQVVDAGSRIDDQQLPEGGALDLFREALHALSTEEVFGATVSEARNHARE